MFQSAKDSPISSQHLPTFSIIFETENLASAELENIYRSLNSLSQQTIPLSQAQEFLIIDSGYAPEAVIQEICTAYPWITVHKAPSIGYHEAKMLGASLVTGDVVVFCDSDCEYVPDWLSQMLTPFGQHPEVQIMAGETTCQIRNPYELAIAINYFLPRFSRHKQPYIDQKYFLNNVAFRRDFLLENPFPCNLPVYRGNCDAHCMYLFKKMGYQNILWKNPQAKAIHEPPTFESTCFWRFFVMGHDHVVNRTLKQLLMEDKNLQNYRQDITNFGSTPWQQIQTLFSHIANILRHIKRRNKTGAVLKEDITNLIFLPLAIPLLIWFEFLYFVGSLTTYFQPDLILDLYQKQEEQEAAENLQTQPIFKVVNPS